MSFFSRLFGRASEEEKRKRRDQEIAEVFPGLRRAQEQNRRLDEARSVRMRQEAEAVARGEPPVPPLSPADEAAAQRIKRLLLGVSFYQTRDRRAYVNASRQLRELGKELRDSGGDRWQRVRQHVQSISGEHWIGLHGFYQLLGEPPTARPAEPGPVAPPAAERPPVPVEAALSSAREIAFGRRAIASREGEPRTADDLPVLNAPDLAALAAAPARMERCFLVCHMRIPGHEHPAAEVVQAWAAALGSDLTKVLGTTTVRQTLALVQETGELVLHLDWNQGVPRELVASAAAAVQPYLGESGA
jgi:hypothetical protein